MKKTTSGFTLVELLIVIVVIAILAAISIVAYTGIQNRANNSAVQSDLRNAGMKLVEHYTLEGAYPAATLGPIGALELQVSKSAYGPGFHIGGNNHNFAYCRSSVSDEVGLVAWSQSGQAFEFTTGGGIREFDWTPANLAQTCSRAGFPDANSTKLWLYQSNADPDGWRI